MPVENRPTLPIDEVNRIFRALRVTFKEAHVSLGLEQTERPPDIDNRGPRIPVNVTGLHSNDLGNLLVVFRGWSEYIEDRLVEESSTLDSLTSEKESVLGALMSDPTILPVSERAKIVKASPAWIGMESKVLIQKHRVSIVKKEARRLSKDYAALSRIIELRVGLQRQRGGSGEDLFGPEDIGDDEE